MRGNHISLEDTLENTMEELWTKLKDLQDSKDELINELGDKRYALDRLGKKIMNVIEQLDSVSESIQEVTEKLEDAFGIPEGGEYTIDMDKRELIYEPEPIVEEPKEEKTEEIPEEGTGDGEKKE